MRFRASIELAGKTATGFEVPAAVVAKLGWGKPSARLEWRAWATSPLPAQG